jgi:hypothetical protein
MPMWSLQSSGVWAFGLIRQEWRIGSRALARVPYVPRISFASLIRPGFFNQPFQVKAWSPSEQDFALLLSSQVDQ